LEYQGDRRPAEAAAVVGMLREWSREIRDSALWVLVHVAEYVGVKMPLLEALLALTQDRYEKVKAAAKLCLEKLGQRIDVEFVDKLFHHKELSICVASVELLGKYASFNQLVTAMQDRRSRVREAAGWRGGPESPRRLLRAVPVRPQTLEAAVIAFLASAFPSVPHSPRTPRLPPDEPMRRPIRTAGSRPDAI